MNWGRIFARLFEMMELRETYYSGGRFLTKVKEIDPYFPTYNALIESRRRAGQSTSRRDYFYDVLMSFEEANRVRLLNLFLDDLRQAYPDKVAALEAEIGGTVAVPVARVDAEAWNADRLNRILSEMDSRLATQGGNEGVVTLAYTGLEGFLKAFVARHLPNYTGAQELIALSRAVRDHLSITLENYPSEALSMLNHVAHTVDRARNRFSDSHFDQEAGRWLAVFVRDLVNAEIRLLLAFY